MAEDSNPRFILGERMLADAMERVKYQHEFSLAGFRALLLINGGAIVGLLTYAGNALGPKAAMHLERAFFWYVVGLVTTTAAHVFAYYSQGLYMQVEFTQAQEHLGLREQSEEQDGKQKRVEWMGTCCIFAAVGLVLVALASFLGGSFAAMDALTSPTHAATTSQLNAPK